MMLSPSEAYELNIRQEPERARVAGIKEKGKVWRSESFGITCLQGFKLNTDRKPVDPPPIIQLHIRNPSDPAQ